MAAIREEFGAAADVIPIMESAGAAVQNFGNSAKEVKSAIEGFKDRLSDLKDEAGETRDRISGLKDALNKTRDAMRELGGTQIKGTQEFKDRLEAVGLEIDKASLNLHKLKLSGATKESIKAAEKALETLRVQAEGIRLEEKVTLDPLRRQAEQLKGVRPEMTIEQITAAYAEYRAEQAELGGSLSDAEALYRDQTTAIKDQEIIIKAAGQALKEMGAEAKGAAGGAGGLVSAVGGLKDKLAGLDLSDAKEKLAAFKEKFEEAKEGIRTAIRQIIEPFENLRDILGNIKVPEFAIDLAGIVVTSEDVEKAFSGLDAKAQDLAATLAPKLKEALRDTVAAMDDLGKALTKTTSDNWPAFVAGTQGAFERLQLLAQDLGAQIVPPIQKMAEAVIAWFDRIVEPAKAAWNNISTALGFIAEAMTSKMIEMTDGWGTAWDRLTQLTAGVWEIIQGIVQIALALIGGTIEVSMNVLAGNWAGAWNAMKQMFQGTWDGVMLILEGALKAIMGILGVNYEQLKADAQAAWAAFTKVIWDYLNGTGGALAIIGQFIWDVLKKLDQMITDVKREAQKVGDALIQGIWNGIQAGWSWLMDRVRDLANAMFAAAKAALGIKSPSQLFMKVGQSVVQGIAAGIKSSQQMLIGTITTLAGNISTATDSISDEIAKRVAGIMTAASSASALPTDAEITEWAKGINLPKWVGEFFVRERGKLPTSLEEFNAFLDAKGWRQQLPGPQPLPPQVNPDPRQIAASAIASLGELGKTMSDALSKTLAAFTTVLNRIMQRSGMPDSGVVGRAATAASGITKAFEDVFGKEVVARWRGLGFVMFDVIEGTAARLTYLQRQMTAFEQLKGLVTGLEDMGEALSPELQGALEGLAATLGGPFLAAIRDFIGLAPARAALRGLQAFIEEFQLGQQLADAVAAMRSAGLSIPDTLLDLLRRVPRVSGSYLDTIIRQIFASLGRSYQMGTEYVPSSGLAYVHRGERIIPAGRSAGTINYNSYNLTIHSNATTEQINNDFAMMRSLAGA